MSKKSFANANPAMAFISMAEDTEDFSLTQSIKAELPIKADPKIGKEEIKIVPETKSKRVQMLMQPSLYNEIKKKAEQKGISVNEMMHEILKIYVAI
ncbi:hypothetical protein ARAF_3016 [Arsenophonus endosymbiont of Aleurodicus floccissimus]|uniref:hypothetical protein n=1 Tax=Arsenophonus endosymbiont of Aleurodicus floccissimus TaxID=2152761 RepID=UPI000E6B1539|nr:hypothetical protein [Arsenophonus endosymbiont of Aleurodicus floccissimus]SPP32649.1 hypothetical protein ARAF_3016 [Arsenophonus endosymbiont of Aleurodicus floccissimus]